MDYFELTPGRRQRVVPYFQPIVNVADGRIHGYEVLGRFEDESGKVTSMGPYFSDPDVPGFEKLIRSRKVRELAFLHASQSRYRGRLFINIKPSWLVPVHRPENDLPTLRLIREAGLSGENVVIEITEDEFDGDLYILDSVIRRYREAGCRVAIDDFTFHNFDRLIHLRPDIVKIDIRLVKKSVEKREYHKLITSISDFSQEIGISVLFEGVELEEELLNSIDAGGNFIQGFFFAQPGPDFLPDDCFRPQVRRSLEHVIAHNRSENYEQIALEYRLGEMIEHMVSRAEDQVNPDALLSGLTSALPEACYRAYICDQFGTQVSANYMRTEQGFERQEQYRGLNWGFRPYFFFNLARMDRAGRGSLSTRYVDQETKRETFTYSHPLSGHRFLFLDLTRGSFASPESND